MTRRMMFWAFPGLLSLTAFAASPGWAQTPSQPAPANPLSDVMTQQTLLGDMGGLRPWLQNYGATLSITETSEVLGNLTGGIRRGFEYDGLTTMTFQLDTARAFGWQGGTFDASALQIHGRNLSADNLLSLQTASGIEADRATRLWELWYQQQFWNGAADIKIGQQSLDQEFMTSTNALLFVNTMFGWPAVPSYDMPGGGPAYPLSAPGIRLRGHPTPELTFLAGVFNGSPSPNNNIPDSQVANPSGTSFPLNGGVLAIAELQYAYPSVGGMVAPGQAQPLVRTYRLGFWYDSENFADQRYDTNGVSLASPASNGIPFGHHGDFGFYAVADQMIWQSGEDSNHSVSLFTRLMGTPESDRNLVDFALNAGVTYHEPLPGRADDTLGLGVGYAHVSGRVAGLDRDTNLFGGFAPVQSGETFVELTYQIQVAPWWQIQPDFQYVFNVGGGEANPLSAIPQKIKNEAVIGVRTNITF
ncbi:MAG TPA: carbohydrate porin [Xanthobacteraceae bacterium]|nr:carbohydrate porin [Xanthobacteraceae bacterium]